MNLLCSSFLFLMIAITADAGEFPKPALMTGDAIRVRDTASEKGKYVGVLYKNMKVDVLEKSTSSVAIEGQSYPWYKIKADGAEGWCAGKFLEFNPKSWVADTYASSGDMDWFNTRYGDATAVSEAQLSEKSFSITEYRELIAAAEHGNRTAVDALRRSIFPYLQNHSDDLAYSYLKPKLYSAETFINISKSGDVGLLQFLPASLVNKEFLEKMSNSLDKTNEYCLTYLPEALRNTEEYEKIALEKHPSAISGVKKARWKEKSFVLKALKNAPVGCSEIDRDLIYDIEVLALAGKNLQNCGAFLDPAKIKDQKLKKEVQTYKEKLDQEGEG
jgi:hypothetical protein